jgi:protein tyrosine phosphatase type 4A
VAIALIEYGMDAAQAVTMIREKRRGAINQVQLNYLEGYRRIRKKGGPCVIM